jgi:hemolysin activation/secretion protein
MAAAQPPMPQGDSSGAQASRFKEASERERAAVDKKKPKKPDIQIEEEKKPSAELPAGPSFTLTDIAVTGCTEFTQDELRKTYESYIGKQVSFKDIDDITTAIKGKYKQKGYLTTTVYVPEQDVKGGRIEIRVLEGRMGEVKVEDNKWFKSELLKRYIHAKKNEILNVFRLQRDILRLNQNSDLEVRAVISPGKEQQATDITLKVKERLPYHAGFTLDNQGTRLVGKYRDAISFRSTNMLGFMDSAFFNTLMGALSQGNYISYAFPIDTYGTKAVLDITTFSMLLGKEYKGFDIAGDTEIYTPHMTAEIYLSEDFQANVDAGLDIKSVKKRQLGNMTANDQLRIFYAAFDLSKIDSVFGGGQTSFSPRFDFSTTHFLGASKHGHPTASRPDTCGFYFKYEQTLRRTQKMFFDSYMTARSNFQIASETLPSSEQFQVGGASTVRGYPEGDYLCDIGATLNVEWVFPTYVFPQWLKLPYAEKPLREQLQPVIFMDLGGGKLYRTYSGERETKFLMGLGGGLRFQFNRNVFLRVDWAERVGDRPSQGQGPSNFYITLQCEI